LLLEAPFNPEGQQRGGLAWILAPDPPPPTAPFNANPTLAGYLTGWWASGQRETWAERRQSVAAALSAVGDRLTWGGLRPLAVMSGLLGAAIGPATAALALLLVYNPAEFVLRGWSVRAGLGGPASVLRDLGRQRLPRLARPLARLLAVTTGFLGGFWLAGFLRGGAIADAAWGILGLLAAWLAHRGARGGPWRNVGLALLISGVWIGIAAIR
jgi:hypothetical protein